MKIILYGRIPSKKNSKNIINRWNRTFIISSKKYIEWEKEQLEYIEIKRLTKQIEIINPLWPLKINCIFFMPDKRRTDLSNKFESIADCLVKAKVIADDNYEILNEVHLYYWWYDKENPRCEIELI